MHKNVYVFKPADKTLSVKVLAGWKCKLYYVKENKI
jgi:hypothetical protein